MNIDKQRQICKHVFGLEYNKSYHEWYAYAADVTLVSVELSSHRLPSVTIRRPDLSGRYTTFHVDYEQFRAAGATYSAFGYEALYHMLKGIDAGKTNSEVCDA